MAWQRSCSWADKECRAQKQARQGHAWCSAWATEVVGSGLFCPAYSVQCSPVLRNLRSTERVSRASGWHRSASGAASSAWSRCIHGCAAQMYNGARQRRSAVSVNLWHLKPGDVVVLEGDMVAGVSSTTKDGHWIMVRFLDAPENPALVGTEDLCSEDEVVRLAQDFGKDQQPGRGTGLERG